MGSTFSGMCLSNWAIHGVAVVDSMFAGSSSSSSSSSSSASVGSESIEEKLAALQLDELLRAERMSASCGDAANLGSRVCLRQRRKQRQRVRAARRLPLLHSHVDRIEPLIQASHADSKRQQRRQGPDRGARPRF